MRSMQVVNVALFLITIRIVQKHSSPAFGAYKYILYQIIIMSLLSQQVSLLGPVFCMPLLGGYLTVELFVSPLAIHFFFSFWIFLTLLDMESIMDGFNYRCRVLLKTFYPEFTNKCFWIGLSVFAKTVTAVIIGTIFFPLGFQMDKAAMRIYIAQNFPNVLSTFDSHNSFFVYSYEMLNGQPLLIASFLLGLFLICGDCMLAILIVFLILHLNRIKMSETTRKMHVRFLQQLLLQACVPFLVIICPAVTLVLLLLTEIPLKTNLIGYVILFVMMMHGPLTSLMTISLYAPYRKACRQFFSRPNLLPSVTTISIESRASVGS